MDIRVPIQDIYIYIYIEWGVQLRTATGLVSPTATGIVSPTLLVIHGCPENQGEIAVIVVI